MPENQRCNTYCEPVFQRSRQTSQLAKKYCFGLRYQVRGTFLEDFVEEVGDKFVIYLSVSSSDGWTDRSHEHKLGRFAKEPSD
jgi:hypothetical protein